MPRVSRSRCAPGALDPGRAYHVANRGTNRRDLFHCDLDRIVFVLMLAEACMYYGAVCHAFCLMTNHFHLVLEDRRGVLPQLMHRLEFCYARYFNATRGRKQTGPVYDSRFRAELIDSRAYFDAACAYVFLNPVHTQTPLAASAVDYRWSSAVLACSDLTPTAWAEGMLAPWGGADGLLAAMRPTKFKSSRELRRARLEAFLSGAWIDRERVLGERTPEEYCLRLAERAARRGGVDEDDVFDALAALAAVGGIDVEPTGAGGDDDRAGVPFRAVTPESADEGVILHPTTADPLPPTDASARSRPVPPSVSARSVVASPLAVASSATSFPDAAKVSGATPAGRQPFAGVALDAEVEKTIRMACRGMVASGLVGICERLGDVVAYTLHRFTNAARDTLATATGLAADAVEAAIDRVRGARRREVASEGALWRLEWALRWKLRAGPHRA